MADSQTRIVNNAGFTENSPFSPTISALYNPNGLLTGYSYDFNQAYAFNSMASGKTSREQSTIAGMDEVYKIALDEEVSFKVDLVINKENFLISSGVFSTGLGTGAFPSTTFSYLFDEGIEETGYITGSYPVCKVQNGTILEFTLRDNIQVDKRGLQQLGVTGKSEGGEGGIGHLIVESGREKDTLPTRFRAISGGSGIQIRHEIDDNISGGEYLIVDANVGGATFGNYVANTGYGSTGAKIYVTGTNRPQFLRSLTGENIYDPNIDTGDFKQIYVVQEESQIRFYHSGAGAGGTTPTAANVGNAANVYEEGSGPTPFNFRSLTGTGVIDGRLPDNEIYVVQDGNVIRFSGQGVHLSNTGNTTSSVKIYHDSPNETGPVTKSKAAFREIDSSDSSVGIGLTNSDNTIDITVDLQSTTDGGNTTTNDINLNGSKIYFDGDADKSLEGDTNDTLLLGIGVTSLKSKQADVVSLFPDNSAAICTMDYGINATSPATGAVIIGGTGNRISGHYNVITAGVFNKISGKDFNFIGGGSGNDVNFAQFSSSLGGRNNDISGANYSVLLGGDQNLIKTGHAHFLGGGVDNKISGSASIISNALVGGTENKILDATYSFIGAGATNTIYANNSVIGGGTSNIASGDSSVIMGGSDNKVLADYGLAAGRYSKVQENHDGAFVLSDSNTTQTLSSGANTLTLNFKSGVYVDSDSGIYINGNPVLTGVSGSEGDTLQIVTDRGNITTTTIQATSFTGTAGLNQFKGSTADTASHTIVARNSSNTSLFSIRNDGRVDIPVGPVNIGNNLYLDNNEIWAQNSNNLNVKADGVIRIQPQSYGTAATFATNGNVGIGTTSPVTKLEVQTDSLHEITSGLLIHNNVSTTGTAGNGVGIIMGRAGGVYASKIANVWTNNNPSYLQTNIAFYTMHDSHLAGSETEKMRLTSQGRLGIGVTNPSERLEVNPNNDSSAILGRAHVGYMGQSDSASFSHIDYANTSNYALKQNNVGNTLINTKTAGTIAFSMNNSTIAAFNNGGDFFVDTDTLFVDASADRVGIGSTSPASKLHIENTAYDFDSSPQVGDLHLMLRDLDNSTSGDAISIGFAQSTDATTVGAKLSFLTEGSYSRGSLVFSTNSTADTGDNTAERLRITSGGFVGIGTSDPSARLHVNGPSAGFAEALRLQRAGGNYYSVGLDNSRVNFVYNSQTTANSALTIDGGNTRVGIGTHAPSRPLHVNAGTTNVVASFGSTDAGAYLSFSDDATTDDTYVRLGAVGDEFQFFAGGGERVRIDSAGFVGIGTNNPQRELEIHGAGNVFARITASTDNDSAGLELNNNGNELWTLKADDTASDAFKITCDGGTALTIDTSKNVGIGTTVPSTMLHVEGTGTFHSVDITGAATLTVSGRAGIGTASPSGILHVYNTGSAYTDKFIVDGSHGRLFNVSDETTGIIFSVNDAAGLPVLEVDSTSGYDKISIGEFGTNALVVSGSKVGIGTDNPDTLLHLEASDPVLKIRDTSDTTNSATLWLQESDNFGAKLHYNSNSTNFFTIGIIDGGTETERFAIDRYGDVKIDTDTLYVDASANRVGIGTTAPARKLEVSESSSSIVSQFKSTAGTSAFITVANTTASADQIRFGSIGNDLVLSTNYTERFRIDSAGNVGIGTTGPNQLLHVDGKTQLGTNGFSEGGLLINYASLSETKGGASTILGNAVYAGTTNNTFRRTKGDAGNYIALNYNKGITFHTNVTGNTSDDYDINNHEQMRITTGGYVGIGTNAPSGTLHVEGTAQIKGAAGWAGVDTQGGAIYMSDVGVGLLGNMGSNYARPLISTSSQTIIIGSNGTSAIRNIKYNAGNGAGTADSEHNFCTSGNNVRLHIAKDGNVGIGTDDPSAHLTIAKTDPKITLYDTAGANSDPNGEITFNETATSENFAIKYNGANDRLEFNSPLDGNTGIMVITRSQNVGIGTINPATKLEVAGETIIDGGVGVNSSATLHLRQKGDTASDGLAITSSHATSHRIWKDANGKLNIGPSSDTDAFVIDLNGNVGIGTTVPSTMLHVEGTGTFHSVDITGASTLTVSGKAGIGTTAPSNLLSIVSTANNNGFRLDYPATSNTAYPFYIGKVDDSKYVRVNANGIALKNNGAESVIKTEGSQNDLNIQAQRHLILTSNETSEAMRIASDGNVGIGSASPQAKIDVVASTNDGIRIDENNALLGSDGTTTGSTQLLYWNGTHAYYGRYTTAPFNAKVDSHFFRTNGSNRLAVRTTGVSINHTNPSFDLDVDGTIHGTSGNFENGITIDGNPVVTGTSAFETDTLQTVTDEGNSTTNAIEVANGTIISGSAATTPAADLYVFGSGNSDVINAVRDRNDASIKVTSTTAGAYFRTNSATSTFNGIDLNQNWFIGQYGHNDLRIVDGTASAGDSAAAVTIQDSTKYVGIGTVNPVSALHVIGDGVITEGNVGIGTTTPITRLVVDTPMNRGQTNPSGLIVTDSANGAMALEMGVDRASNASYIESRHTGSNTNYTLLLNPSYGKVGVGTTSPTSKFEVGTVAYGTNSIAKFWDGTDGVEITNRGASRQQIDFLGSNTSTINAKGSLHINYDSDNNGSNDSIQFSRNGIDEAGTLDMIIKEGNVGIGTDNPTFRLDVETSDEIVASFVSTDNKGGVLIQDDDTSAYVSVENNKLALGPQNGIHATQNLNYDLINYRLGIGTNSPTSKLHVYGGDNTGLFGSIRNDFTNRMNMKVAMGSTTRYIGTVDQYGNGDSSGFTVKVYDGAEKVFRIVRVVVQNSGGTNFVSATVEGGGEDTDIHINLEYKNRDGDATKTDFFLVPTSKNFSQYVEIEGYIVRDTGWNTTSLTSVSLDDDLALNILDSVNGSRVGIATTSPEGKLDVAANTDQDVFLGRARFGSHVTDYLYLSHYDNANTTSYALKQSPAGSTAINAKASMNVSMNVNNDPIVFVKGSTSNVGIGTTDPSGNLHVQNGASSKTLNDKADELVVESLDHGGISILTPDAKRGQLYFNNDAFLRWVGDDDKLSINTSASSTTIAIAESAGDTTFGGNVGIGTTNPSAELEIAASEATLRLTDSDLINHYSEIEKAGVYTYLYSRANAANGGFIFLGDNGTTDTEFMRIATDGNVGIGSNTPSAKLDVAGGIKLLDNNYLTWNTSNTRIIGNSNYLQFQVAASDKVRIQSDGNVGIGTNSPQELLHIDGSSPRIRLRDSDAAGTPYAHIDASDGALLIEADKGDETASSYIALTVDGSESIRAIAGGNVGIGTSSPSYELDVNGTTRSTYYIGGAYFEENASSSKIKFYPNGTVLVMDEDGELKPCEKENDTLVFGVSKRDFEQPIVLGAEPILVTGPIKVGDYIVTSSKQGHGQAMKEQKLGTIIAQAMENGDGESYNIKAMIRKM